LFYLYFYFVFIFLIRKTELFIKHKLVGVVEWAIRMFALIAIFAHTRLIVSVFTIVGFVEFALITPHALPQSARGLCLWFVNTKRTVLVGALIIAARAFALTRLIAALNLNESIFVDLSRNRVHLHIVRDWSREFDGLGSRSFSQCRKFIHSWSFFFIS
jgi:hypothetical protein